MRKKDNLSEFERGAVVGARRAGLSISGILPHNLLKGLQRTV